MFIFEIPRSDLRRGPAELFVEVCSHVASKMELFAVLACGLRFPDYFGKNWDALDECLHFLETPEISSIVILHRSLPNLPDDELATYISILASAEDSLRSDDRDLTVIFPPDAEQQVQRLRREAEQVDRDAN